MIYALDVNRIEADEQTSAAVVGFQLHFHTLAKAALVGLYSR